MVQASQKRELAIKQSLDSYYDDMSILLEKRRQLIDVVWKMNDSNKRQNGFKAIWRGFGQAWRMAGLQLRDERRNAWMEYRTAVSDCGMAGRDEEAGGLGVDAQY